jgi:hypothetical protein
MPVTRIAESDHAADLVCGPSDSGRTLFFPESERTGPPVGGRPLSTVPDTPGARARRARAVREMTIVSSKAARENALYSAELGSHRTVSRRSSRGLRLLAVITRKAAGHTATTRGRPPEPVRPP